MRVNFNFLKLIYKSFLFGFPRIVYNPTNVNVFHSSYSVLPYSTYVNFKLNHNEYNYVNDYLMDKDGGLNLEKIKIEDNENNEYYLSINMYNCSSPLFELLGKDIVTRCEINTYVKNELNDTGTLILDYTSNMLSMDPVNIFKKPEICEFKINENEITCRSQSISQEFFINYNISDNDKCFNVSEELHEYTDNIFYTNGVYDKLYYDRTLIHGITNIPSSDSVHFRIGGIVLTNPSSIFYFKDNLNFAGGMWYNIFDKIDPSKK